MKITKRQLRRIIKEERRKLSEANYLSDEAIRQMRDQDEEAYDAKVDEMKAAIRRAIRAAISGPVSITIDDVENACEQTILEFYYS